MATKPNGSPGHPARPLTGPTAHFYLWSLEQIAAGEKQLADFTGKDFAILEYAQRARAEQQINQHKKGARAGGAKCRGAKKAGGRFPQWTIPKLLKGLRELAVTLNRTPRQQDLQKAGLPWWTTYQRRFGSYAQACIQAGLKVNQGSPLR